MRSFVFLRDGYHHSASHHRLTNRLKQQRDLWPMLIGIIEQFLPSSLMLIMPEEKRVFELFTLLRLPISAPKILKTLV